jgi:long-chain acyl-CoA synthetase
MMKQSRFIEQIMVVVKVKCPAAFIQTNFDFIKEWAALHKFNIGSTNEEIAANERKVSLNTRRLTKSI